MCGGALITMATNPHHLVTHLSVVIATEEHHTVTYGHVPKETSPTLRRVKDSPTPINYSSVQIVPNFPVPWCLPVHLCLPIRKRGKYRGTDVPGIKLNFQGGT